jgi:hypothetical protein
VTTDEEVKARLAKAMAAEDGERSGSGVDWNAYAAAILPVVRELQAEEAARLRARVDRLGRLLRLHHDMFAAEVVRLRRTVARVEKHLDCLEDTARAHMSRALYGAAGATTTTKETR